MKPVGLSLTFRINKTHRRPNTVELTCLYECYYLASGCIDIIPPEDAWLKRNGDDIVIGCYSSKQTWYLRCEEGKWSGSIGNCSLKIHGLKFNLKLFTFPINVYEIL